MKISIFFWAFMSWSSWVSGIVFYSITDKHFCWILGLAGAATIISLFAFFAVKSKTSLKTKP